MLAGQTIKRRDECKPDGCAGSWLRWRPSSCCPPRSGPLARGQPTAIREHSTVECGRAEPCWALGGVEQSADEQLRHLHDTAGVPFRWHGLSPCAASHRRPQTGFACQLPPDLVPHIEWGMENQELKQSAPKRSTASEVACGETTLLLPAIKARLKGPTILPTPFAACPSPDARAPRRTP